MHLLVSRQVLRYYIESIAGCLHIDVEKNYPKPDKYAGLRDIVFATVSIRLIPQSDVCAGESIPTTYLDAHHRMPKSCELPASADRWPGELTVCPDEPSLNRAPDDIQWAQIHQNR